MSRRHDIARRPTNAPRGSPKRIQIYRLRVALGLTTNQPGDTEDIEPVAAIHQYKGETFKTRGGHPKLTHKLLVVRNGRPISIADTTTRDSL